MGEVIEQLVNGDISIWKTGLLVVAGLVYFMENKISVAISTIYSDYFSPSRKKELSDSEEGAYTNAISCMLESILKKSKSSGVYLFKVSEEEKIARLEYSAGKSITITNNIIPLQLYQNDYEALKENGSVEVVEVKEITDGIGLFAKKNEFMSIYFYLCDDVNFIFVVAYNELNSLTSEIEFTVKSNLVSINEMLKLIDQ